MTTLNQAIKGKQHQRATRQNAGETAATSSSEQRHGMEWIQTTHWDRQRWLDPLQQRWTAFPHSFILATFNNSEWYVFAWRTTTAISMNGCEKQENVK